MIQSTVAIWHSLLLLYLFFIPFESSSSKVDTQAWAAASCKFVTVGTMVAGLYPKDGMCPLGRFTMPSIEALCFRSTSTQLSNPNATAYYKNWFKIGRWEVKRWKGWKVGRLKGGQMERWKGRGAPYLKWRHLALWVQLVYYKYIFELSNDNKKIIQQLKISTFDLCSLSIFPCASSASKIFACPYLTQIIDEL